jgi:hypothetical protein
LLERSLAATKQQMKQLEENGGLLANSLIARSAQVVEAKMVTDSMSTLSRHRRGLMNCFNVR